MSALTVRKLSEPVHDALRRIAVAEGKSVEAVAREALEEKAKTAPSIGLDLAAIVAKQAELGVSDIGEDWIAAFDDTALSEQVLGLSSSE